ncbi:MAG: ATP-binding cassette domain-containing protein [Alphaproteobacteria bacterium]|nr:ATP-binding cassette domain-containing protein [Alphaproteobacteria bacterium]
MSLVLEQVGITLEGDALIAPFSLSIAPGEIVTLMGPSGSGKSSLLSGLAGLLAPPLAWQGRVLLNGEDLGLVAPARRRLGRLFQDDLLFPHLSVGENLLFGMARGGRALRLARMREALAETGLAGFENRPPHTLSGGQRQRVALMRSLLAQPLAMLLDEPFNKLDAALRSQIRSSTFDLLQARGTPSLLVTHDLADVPPGGRVLKIENGKVKDA